MTQGIDAGYEARGSNSHFMRAFEVMDRTLDLILRTKATESILSKNHLSYIYEGHSRYSKEICL